MKFELDDLMSPSNFKNIHKHKVDFLRSNVSKGYYEDQKLNINQPCLEMCLASSKLSLCGFIIVITTIILLIFVFPPVIIIIIDS